MENMYKHTTWTRERAREIRDESPRLLHLLSPQPYAVEVAKHANTMARANKFDLYVNLL